MNHRLKIQTSIRKQENIFLSLRENFFNRRLTKQTRLGENVKISTIHLTKNLYPEYITATVQ